VINAPSTLRSTSTSLFLGRIHILNINSNEVSEMIETRQDRGACVLAHLGLNFLAHLDLSQVFKIARRNFIDASDNFAIVALCINLRRRNEGRRQSASASRYLDHIRSGNGMFSGRRVEGREQSVAGVHLGSSASLAELSHSCAW
jgi:hypothetical protein